MKEITLDLDETRKPLMRRLLVPFVAVAAIGALVFFGVK